MPLGEFLFDREAHLMERRGFETGEIKAIADHWAYPRLALQRVEAVAKYRDSADDSRSPPAEFADDLKVIGLLGMVESGIDLLYQIEADPARKAQAIADVQVALQYCRGGWFARGGWQAQYWDTLAHTDNDEFDASRASLGLSGFFVAVGGQR